MATHLYCLLTPPRPEARSPSLVGVGHQPVRALVAGDLEAWVSNAPRDLPVSTESKQMLVARVLEHDAVLDAALATGRTPLPARFGQHFDDDDAVLRALERDSRQLRALLSNVDGAVEMAVIIAPKAPEAALDPRAKPSPALDTAARGAGLQYLKEIRARIAHDAHTRESLESVAGRVSRAVAPLVRAEHRLEQQGRFERTMSLAHLVNREGVERYRAAVASLDSDDAWRLVVAGPRAPYSFGAVGGDPTGTILAD